MGVTCVSGTPSDYPKSGFECIKYTAFCIKISNWNPLNFTETLWDFPITPSNLLGTPSGFGAGYACTGLRRFRQSGAGEVHLWILADC